jgi:hypothetical protein
MSIFKAFGKSVLRMGSNALFYHDEKSSQKSAYAKTGRAINKAKKNNSYIDGRKTYQRNYNAAMQKSNERKSLRDSFINDL